MINIKNMNIQKDEIYSLIKKNLFECQDKIVKLEDAKYHHNIAYEDTISALKHGILSLEELYKIQGKILSYEDRIKYSREGGHINGVDEISLSSMDIDFDRLYDDERIYDPYSDYKVDILISNNIKAYRITEHYANEFLTENKIVPENFKAIDIRLLNYLNNNCDDIIEGVKYCNYLIDIANAMKKYSLDIPLREMSNKEIHLDKEKVLQLTKIIIK